MDLCLERWHRARIVLDHLRRQLLQHLLFRTAKDKWRYPTLQALERIDEQLCLFQILRHLLYVSRQVLIVCLVKDGLFLEEIGHQKVKETPQLAHAVLQGCT